MLFAINRETLLRPLQLVSGSLGGRPTLPILSNVLLNVDEDRLSMTGTDLEVEMIGRVMLEPGTQPGKTTVPARKLLDICRGLPEAAIITFQLEADRLILRSGRSRFSLSTLPAEEFPNIEDWESLLEFDISQLELKRLIESTQFSMASQDVRYYLNGMLFEATGKSLRTVATDGHRLATCRREVVEQDLPEQQLRFDNALPRRCQDGLRRLARALLKHGPQPGHVQHFLTPQLIAHGQTAAQRRSRLW